MTQTTHWGIVLWLSIAIQLVIWSTVGPQPWYINLLAGAVAGTLCALVLPTRWRRRP